ncbi:MAG: radical SAM protein [Coriobacteriia bacterium]|nr:radical SAM protein [Coriobacteriia bacterium]
MGEDGLRHIYGPVPSRRLGRSLGIDLVPFKVCSYDCVYCQLGRTTDKTVERKHYVLLDEILAELRERLENADRPDYISLAGSGEPTLHAGIGDLIRRIKDLTDIPVAVLTNGSLLWMPDVRDALMAADLVLPSLDAGDERSFLRVNRPHPAISFDQMVEGLVTFTEHFPGEVWLEVLLLKGITGTTAEAEEISTLIERIRPTRVQLNTAWRPSAEAGVRALSAEEMVALQTLLPGVVDIISEDARDEREGPTLSDAGDTDILALLGRRPCTAADVAAGLSMHVAEALKHLDVLVASGAVTTVVIEGRTYYAAGHRETPGP